MIGMRRVLLLIDSKTSKLIRVISLFTITGWLVVAVLRAQTTGQIEAEHRFSVAETEILSVQEEIKVMHQEIVGLREYETVKMLALVGLAGEAGVRVMKNRKGN